MSTVVDTQVVSMKFDARDFDNNVRETMSLLDKFKSKLNFNGATKGIEDISKAADKVKLTHLEEAAMAVEAKFSTMSIVAISAINNIVNSAMNAGKQIVKSLSVDQITSGFGKYESKMTSVQTIMNATGLSIEEVSAQLDKLIWFTDETSYSFTDMVNNVGKFTSNQIDLGIAVKSMMGIANAAGLAGASVENASHAMDGFSKAMGKGYMENQNWEWIRTAKMDTAAFKQLLLDAAVAEGTLTKVRDGLYQTLAGNEVTIADFQSNLKDKWLNNNVMLRGLGEFGDYAEAVFQMCEEEGILASEAIERLSGSMSELGEKGFRAAQEAKTFTDALNATKDAVSSKWMQTFELIFGNYEEAKVIWTELAETLYDIFAASGDVRNEMLKSWVELDGRALLISTIKTAYESLLSVVRPLKQAFSELFPSLKATDLINITNRIKDFVGSLKMSQEAAYSLKVIFKALLVPLKALTVAIEVGVVTIGTFIKLIFQITDAFLSMLATTNPIEDFFRNIFGDERYIRLMESMSIIIGNIGSGIKWAGSQIGSIVKNIKSSDRITKFLESVSKILKPIAEIILDAIVDGIEALAKFDFRNLDQLGTTILNNIINNLGIVGKILGGILFSIVGIGSTIKDYFNQITSVTDPSERIMELKTAFTGLNTTIGTFKGNFTLDALFSGTSVIADKLTGVVSGLGTSFVDLVNRMNPAKILLFSFGVGLTSSMFSLSKALTSFAMVGDAAAGLIKNLSTTLTNFNQRLKPNRFVQNVKAIILLAGAVALLSFIDPERLWNAVGAVSVLSLVLTAVTGALAAMDKYLVKDTSKMASLTANMIKVSTALFILSTGLAILGRIETKGLGGKIAAVVSIIVVLGTIVTLMSRFGKQDISKNAAVIVGFALSLTIMVSALKKLQNFNGNALLQSVGTLITLMSLLALMSRAMDGIKFSGAVGVTLMIGNLYLFINALKFLEQVDIKQIASVIPTYIIVMTLLSGLMFATQFAGKNAAKAGVFLVAISAAMVILGEAIKNIGSLDLATVAKGGTAVALLLVIFTVLTAVTRLVGEHTDKMSKAIVMMSISLMLLSVCISYLGALDLPTVLKGMGAVSAMLVVIALVMKLNSAVVKEGEKFKSASGAIIAMAALLGILTASLALLTLLDENQLLKAAGSLSAVILSLGIAIKLMEKTDWKAAGKSLASMTVTLIGLSVLLSIFGQVDVKDGLVDKALSLGILLIAIAAAVKLLPGLNKTEWMKGTYAAMGIFAGILVELAVILGLLRNINPVNAIANAAALSMLLLSISAAVRLLPDVRIAQNMSGSYKAMLAFMLFLGEVSVLLQWMDGIDPVGALANAGALSVLLLSLSAAMRILPDFQDIDPAKSTLVFVELGLMLVALSGILLGLQTLEIEANMANVAALSILLLSLATAARILPDFKDIKVGKALLTLGVLELAMAGIALILKLVGEMEIEVNIGKVVLLSALIISLSAAARILSGMKDVNLGGALKALIAVSALFIEIGAIGYLLKTLEDSGFFDMERLIKGFEGIGAALGSAIGSFINHLVVSGLFSGLPDIGTYLSDFISNLLGFTDGLKKVDAKVITGAANLAVAILLISGAEIVNALANFLPGTDNPLSKFGDQLVEFGPKLSEFADSISGIGSRDFSVVSVGVKTLAEAYSAIHDGFFEDTGKAMFGDNTLANFGKDLEAFGPSLAAFANSLVDIDQDKFTQSVGAAKTLAEFEAALPKHGGWVQTILGDSDLGTFGENLESFGYAMVAYSNAISGKGKTKNGGAGGTLDTKAIADSVKAGQALADLEKSLRSHNGNWQGMFGDADLSSFGDSLADFGKGMLAYSDAITKNGGIDVDAVTASVPIGQALADLENGLGAKDGVWQTIFGGSQSLSDFANNIGAFGEGLVNYSAALDDVNFENISKSAEIGRALSELEAALPETSGFFKLFDTKQDFNEFGLNIWALGQAFRKFGVNLDGVDLDRINGAIQSIGSLTDLAQKLEGINSAGMDGFTAALKHMASGTITDFINEFYLSEERLLAAVNDVLQRVTNEIKKGDPFVGTGLTIINLIIDEIIQNETKLTNYGSGMIGFILMGMSTQHDSLKAQGSYLVTCVCTGITDKKKDLTESIENLLLGTLRFIKDNKKLYNASKEVGQYTIQGLIAGINAESTNLNNAMTNISKGMIETTKEVLDEHSPSVEFEKIGINAIAGLEEGLEEMQPSLNRTVKTSGKAIIQQMIDDFRIQDGTSLTMRDRVGTYLIKGIAEGIYTDMSAEEAAAQKAKNITEAFESALDLRATKAKISSNNYSIWELLYGETASDSEKKSMQDIDYRNRLAFAGQDYMDYMAQYDLMASEFGESSKSAIDAWEKAQEALKTFLELANEYKEAMTETSETTEQSFRDLAVSYNSWLAQWKSTFAEQGFTNEQIEEMARNATGFNPNITPGEVKVEGINVNDLLDEFISDYKIEIDAAGEIIQTRTTESVSSGIRSGGYSGYRTGIEDLTSLIQNDTGGFDPLSDAISEKIKSGIDIKFDEVDGSNIRNGLAYLADNWIDGFNLGIENYGHSSENVVLQWADNLYEGAKDFFGINSPSKLMMELGRYIMEGLEIGLTDKKHSVTQSFEAIAEEVFGAFSSETNTISDMGRGIAESIINGLNSTVSEIPSALRAVLDVGESTINSYRAQYYQAGYTLAGAMVQGLIDSVQNGKSQAINEIVQLATQAYQAACSALDIGGMAVGISMGSAGDTPSNMYQGIDGRYYQKISWESRKAAMVHAENQITPSVTSAMASSINSAYSGGRNSTSQNGTSNGSVTYNFYQTNTSPKALSRIDIYRDTSNLLSSAKGVT